ncbi:UNVERIFIED_CONTAM: hypothetical protein HDU68_012687 [Siphonaria sp. JEL0065]|nr:hypothetical protein HDU68_012687 [Siphonaria sp. JEL0065]
MSSDNIQPTLDTIVSMLAQLQTQVALLTQETSQLKAQNNLILHQTNTHKRFLTQFRDLPFEVAARIFSFVSPTEIFKFRKLSKSTNAVLLSPFFAALSVAQHVDPLSIAPAKRRLAQQSTKPDPIGKIWFLVPENYQSAYADAKLKHLETLQWISIDWFKFKQKTLSTHQMRDAPFIQLIQMGLAFNNDGRMRRTKPSPLLISIPNAIHHLVNLKTLQLSSSELSGPIPESIGVLVCLEILNLSDNKLQGLLPTTFSKLVKLKELNLFGNELEGALDPLFSLSLSLRKLNIHQNKFTGTLDGFTQLTNIVGLFISNNSFSGPIPLDFGSCLPNLVSLDMFGNQLTGSIPESMGQLTRLQHLNCMANQLDGAIPASLGLLPNLTFLSLRGNKFNGEIPSEIFNIATLQTLNLSENNLQGSIPGTGIPQLVHLVQFFVDHNELSGEIPDALWDLAVHHALHVVNLSFNKFSGKLSENIAGVVAVGEPVSRLAVLNLSNNQLSGQIPDAICELPNLESLFLAGNQFVGELPEGFGALILDRVELKSGNTGLSGKIPASVVEGTRLFELLVLDGFYKVVCV